MDDIFKKRVVIFLAGVLVIGALLLGFIINQKALDKAVSNYNSAENTDNPDESYFVPKNEKGSYKLETDKVEVFGGVTFYNFKMKDYKNGYQKIEIMVRNDGTENTIEKKYVLELVDNGEMTKETINIEVSSLKPGEKHKIVNHIKPDITGIINFRIAEFSIDN